jgi:hypothetical protein
MFEKLENQKYVVFNYFNFNLGIIKMSTKITYIIPKNDVDII